MILANTKISQHVCSCRFSTQQTMVCYCRSYLYTDPAPSLRVRVWFMTIISASPISIAYRYL